MAMTRRKLAGWANLLLSGALALGVWGLATVLFTRPAMKVLADFSPQARFSVEPATKKLLKEIRESGKKVQFHTLFLPASAYRVQTPEQRQEVANLMRVQGLTRDLLRQYQYLGGDAVQVTYHDVMAKPAEVKEVLREIADRRYNTVIVKMGQRSKVLNLEGDLAEFDVPLSGESPIPGGRQPVRTLKNYKGEEAISTALKRLMVEGEPVVYVLSGLSRMSMTDGIATSFSEFAGALGDDGFHVVSLDLHKEGRIPDDAAVVAVLEPQKPLRPDESEQLFEFLRRGGRVLLNVAFLEAEGFNPSFEILGKRLGFALSSRPVCQLLQDPRFPNVTTSGTPMVQNIVATNLNPTHPVTGPLVRRHRWPQLKACREITKIGTAEQGVRLDTSFMRTGPGAWLEDLPIDYQAPPAGPGVYAPRCIGAVADVDPAPDAKGARTGHFVLIAGSVLDNLSFKFNGDFVLNLFNWMTERDALISIRGSKYVPRDLDLTPPQLDRVFELMVYEVPGGLLLLGLLVFWRRSRA